MLWAAALWDDVSSQSMLHTMLVPNVLRKAQILVDAAASGQGNLFMMSRALITKSYSTSSPSTPSTLRSLPSSMGGIGVTGTGGGMGGVDDVVWVVWSVVLCYVSGRW